MLVWSGAEDAKTASSIVQRHVHSAQHRLICIDPQRSSERPLTAVGLADQTVANLVSVVCFCDKMDRAADPQNAYYKGYFSSIYCAIFADVICIARIYD